MLGPIDYVVVGFKGNNFNGGILDELSKATKQGVIRVIDLVFVVKDKDGQVIGGEVSDQPQELKQAYSELGMSDDMYLLSESDIEKVGEDMENDTAAGVLVVEQLWAKGLKQAIKEAGGFLIKDGRIHPEVAEEAAREFELKTA